MKSIGWIFAAVVIGVSFVSAADLSLTVYSQNYAIVRETDTVNLEAGENEIRHEVITKYLLDEPIRFSGEGLQLLEQRYEYDVPTLGYLLEKNVGKQIELDLAPDNRLKPEVTPGGTIRGIILSDLSGKNHSLGERFLLKEEDGSIRTIRQSLIDNYHFISTPEDLTEDPTLVWTVETVEAGPHEFEATYETLGFAWDAEYLLDLDGNDSTATFSCWVSVHNGTDKTLKDAELNLVYGNPQRNKRLELKSSRVEMESSHGSLSSVITKKPGFKIDGEGKIHFRGGRDTEAAVKVDGQTFRNPIASSSSSSKLVNFSNLNQEEIQVLSGGDASHGGYQSALINVASEQFLSMNLYHMPHRVTLKNEAATELSLIPQTEIKLKTFYEYFPRRGPAVNVQMKLTNADSVGLGIPLPPGPMKIYQLSDAGTPEFVSEVFMNHLGTDEKRQIMIGQSSEVKVVRNRLDYIRHSDRKFDETWELKVSNKKDVPIEIIIYEDFPHDFKMLESTNQWQQRHQPRPRSVKLPMIVQPGQERVVRYTVRMTSDYDLPENR